LEDITEAAEGCCQLLQALFLFGMAPKFLSVQAIATTLSFLIAWLNQHKKILIFDMLGTLTIFLL
jgi:hypothetical protein